MEAMLRFERNCNVDNLHHGNLLFSPELPRPAMRMIAGVIGLVCEVLDESHTI
jgi:hypothetical protein